MNQNNDNILFDGDTRNMLQIIMQKCLSYAGC